LGCNGDHLGNVRLSYSDANNNGKIEASSEILKERNYYPLGLEHKGYNSNVVGAVNNFETFNGKELDESLGLNVIEMDWRQYDPAIGRFNVIDPMAEERDWLSPYNFAQNNPILRVDPTGLLDDYGLDTETGDLVFLKETDATTDTIYTGEVTGTNDDGSSSFKKDGKSSKTFKKGSSNIKEVTTTTDENGKTVGTGQGASASGLVFSEGNLQTGLDVMEFISFESKIELNGWGFQTDKGKGLYISYWSENSYHKSEGTISPYTDSVEEINRGLGFGRNKSYGKKIGHVHTHPGDGNSGNGYGYGNASPQDKKVRKTGKNKKYPHYINSKHDGWKKY
jgi:RHS repeat-associated protein